MPPELAQHDTSKTRRTRRLGTPPHSAPADLTLPQPSGRDAAEQLWIHPDHVQMLRHAGLTTFDAIMNDHGGHCLRKLPARENWRLELAKRDGTHVTAYLKKHRHRDVFSRLRLRRRRRPASPARHEAEMLVELDRDGIPAMELIAFGEKRTPSGHHESFLLTKELAGFTQLDHFIRQRFAPRSKQSPSHRDRDLRTLVGEVADAAAHFHACGYNHRDLYCCHFFIRESVRGEFAVHLIDLQRVQHRRRFRHRWIVKDLAQLAYSAPAERIGATHRLAFIKRYLGIRKLRPADKRLIRQVLAKQDRMERKLGLHP